MASSTPETREDVMALVELNGTTLYYELSGSRGEQLVLVHGSWGDHHNWDAVVPELARRFRVLTYDRRGHSQSATSIGPGSVREDVGDLAALIEHLGLAPAHVVGNSFGASISLRLAAERPELLQSLTVHEPPLFDLLAGDESVRPVLASMRERIEATAAMLEAGDMEGGARQFVETLAMGPGWWEQLPPEMRSTFVTNAHTWLDEVHDPETLTLDLGALRRFDRPTLVTDSDDSPRPFSLVVGKIAAALPAAQRRTFRGGGHVPHVRVPEDYVRVVGRFATRPRPAQGELRF